MKRLPYWLLGGLICGGIAGIFVVLIYLCGWFFPGANLYCTPFMLFGPMLPFYLLMVEPGSYFRSLPYSQVLLIGVVAWFIVGCVLGAVTGLIKRLRTRMK